jgi:hypothetical protein
LDAANYRGLYRSFARENGKRSLSQSMLFGFDLYKPLGCKAERGLAAVACDREGMSENRIRALLRRFLWLLSDESGNGPYGVPEAFGEVLVARPEFQAEFLPLLCSLAYDPERIQTGPIEQGVFWALGRVGQPAAACSPEAVEAVVRASRQHPEPETRSIANWARSRF